MLDATSSLAIVTTGLTDLTDAITQMLTDLVPTIIVIIVLFAGIMWLKRLYNKRY